MSGSVLSDRAIQQINQLYRDFYAFKNQWQAREFRPVQFQQKYYAKLDGDLAAAVAADSETASAPTATASIYVGNSSGGIEDSGNNVTVVNRFGIEYLAGTLGIVEFFCGEWVWMGDCAPLS